MLVSKHPNLSISALLFRGRESENIVIFGKVDRRVKISWLAAVSGAGILCLVAGLEGLISYSILKNKIYRN